MTSEWLNKRTKCPLLPLGSSSLRKAICHVVRTFGKTMKKCMGLRTDPSQWPTPIRHASKELFCPKYFLTCVKPLILEARSNISDQSLWDCTLTWQKLYISVWRHMGLKLCLKCLPTPMCSMHPCYWTHLYSHSSWLFNFIFTRPSLLSLPDFGYSLPAPFLCAWLCACLLPLRPLPRSFYL